GPLRPEKTAFDHRESVSLTLTRSLNEMRTAEPCGHIWTHAGPALRPTHRSHLVARLMDFFRVGLLNGTSTMLCHGQRVTQLLQPMHVLGSIVTSSVPIARVIAPVGQPMRHTGSLH